jgi:hypothetical protein
MTVPFDELARRVSKASDPKRQAASYATRYGRRRSDSYELVRMLLLEFAEASGAHGERAAVFRLANSRHFTFFDDGPGDPGDPVRSPKSGKHDPYESAFEAAVMLARRGAHRCIHLKCSGDGTYAGRASEGLYCEACAADPAVSGPKHAKARHQRLETVMTEALAYRSRSGPADRAVSRRRGRRAAA